MGYQKVEPVSDRKMRRQRYKGHNTICQVLRDIYEMTYDERIRVKCREGMAYAKRMHKKLKEYKDADSSRTESGRG